MARQENPIEKYGMARYDVANKKPRGQEGTFQRRDGNQARDEARAAANDTTPPTFAELQSQGRPRPAKPAAQAFIQPYGGMPMGMESGDAVAPNPIPTPSQPTPQATQTRSNPVQETLTPPGAPGSDDPRWSSILANLEAQFAGQRRRLDTDLARRGMWASTGELGAGAALGDLEGQQSRALASARTEYGMQQDDRYDNLMRMLLPIIMGNGG